MQKTKGIEGLGLKGGESSFAFSLPPPFPCTKVLHTAENFEERRKERPYSTGVRKVFPS